MSNPGEADETPVTAVRQLAGYIAEGCKPRERFSIGTEHEKFGFRRADLTPVPYEPEGIRALLERMRATDPDGGVWDPITDAGNIIGLTRGRASVSLEPAGQLELSGGTLASLHETRAEMDAHFAQVRAAAEPLGLGFAPLGFHPTARRDEMPWMPKRRYAIMRRYMPAVGKLGLDMMTRTCTVQVNLDYESEADMARKLRVSLALQPVATALFANSPFTEGEPNGFLSYRAHIWTDTDNQRSGMPLEFFEPDFGFERYVEWLLNVPMYFVVRQGDYVDLAGRSFRDFMEGRFDPALGLGPATLGDFGDHMTTVFTDVRVKRFLEMRGADAGSPTMMLAQSAFWVGLLYDPPSLAAADALVRRRAPADYVDLRGRVPHDGLAASWGTGVLRDLARDVLAIASDGLRARNVLNAQGQSEAGYLDPLHAIIDGEPTQAELWLNKYNGPWKGNTASIFRAAEI